MDSQILNPTEVNYQWHKPLDIWSGALWLGAALSALVERAQEGDETALHWVEELPDEVKAQWPGVFPEFPYIGEPDEEHAARLAQAQVAPR